MNGFIEVTLVLNGARIALSVTSIALVEEYPNNHTRIIMKEIVESTNRNLEAIVTVGYPAAIQLIKDAQG